MFMTALMTNTVLQPPNSRAITLLTGTMSEAVPFAV